MSLGILNVGGLVLEIFKTKNRWLSFSMTEALNPTPNKIKVLLCPTSIFKRAFFKERIVLEVAVNILLAL